LRWVLDTGFFLAGMDPLSLEGDAMITPGVREEVVRGFPGRKMDYFMESGLAVVSPSDEYVKRVRESAESTGDSGRLSETDISVIALALERDACVISDDYSIQNICSVLGIEYRGLSERGINEVWEWKYRCTGCKKIFDSPVQECPICGSPVKPVRSRSR